MFERDKEISLSCFFGVMIVAIIVAVAGSLLIVKLMGI